jgi:hypothetical protein
MSGLYGLGIPHVFFRVIGGIDYHEPCNRIHMRNLILGLIVIVAALCVGKQEAKAADVTRICVATYNPSTGALSCSDTGWLPLAFPALTNTVVSVLNSHAGQAQAITCYNPAAAVTYIQIFDAATAGAVTLGTTTPVVTFGVPTVASTTMSTGGDLGIKFFNGIQIAATTTPTGNTAPATAAVCNVLYN